MTLSALPHLSFCGYGRVRHVLGAGARRCPLCAGLPAGGPPLAELAARHVLLGYRGCSSLEFGALFACVTCAVT
jgi:hypothetical protein